MVNARGLFARWSNRLLPPLSPATELRRFTRSQRTRATTASSQQPNISPHDASEPELPTSDSGADQNPPDNPTTATESVEDHQYTYVTSGDNRGRVKKDLTPFQIFMIALNATLGVGLYWRAGRILELGGAVAVLVSFTLVTLLVWAVMQCIGEMLGRWPVPGALSLFVSNFVDYELGIAVGIMYWLTYSVSFAALITTTAGEIRFWIRHEAFDVTVVYIVIPLILIVLSCFPVKYYGWFEVISGFLKIIFLFAILVSMIVFASQPGSQDAIEYNWNDTHAWDSDVSPTRGPVFLAAISTAIFAFVGVEVVAACALEAKPPISNTATNGRTGTGTTAMSSKTRFSVIYFSLIAGVTYTVSGLLITLNVRRDACGLPRLGWLDSKKWLEHCSGPTEGLVTSSAFFIAAQIHHSRALASAFNFFLVFTALTCAQTNLFIASRALYGLATQLHRSQDKFLDILSFFGETNNKGVPVRAVVLSALAFIWVPFLQLQGYHQSAGSEQATAVASADIPSFIDILTEIGTVGVVIVWACECVAFLSYRHYLEKHKEYLRDHDSNYVDRGDHKNYPYRSHFQPVVGGLAFVGCLFHLIVLDSASLYNGFHVEPFLSQFLVVFIFVGLWVFLKGYRRRGWRWNYFDVDLSASGFYETISRLSNLANQ